MANVLEGGERFKITAFSTGNLPIGVNFPRSATQQVYVGAPVNEWTARRVGLDTYHLSVGGYSYVSVSQDGTHTVIASMSPDPEPVKWRITYQEMQGGYTIALAHKPHLGWTVPPGAEDAARIIIAPIVETGSLPPQFLPRQLFLVVRDANADD